MVPWETAGYEHTPTRRPRRLVERRAFQDHGKVEHGVLTIARLVPGGGLRLAIAMINVSRQPVDVLPVGLHTCPRFGRHRQLHR